jgi:hypothetical protein
MQSILQSFCEMMDRLPAAAVKKAAAAERRILEEDTAMGREEAVGEVASVLTFCRFLELADGGKMTILPEVPPEHRPYYAKIVRKLVEAGELPAALIERFGGK